MNKITKFLGWLKTWRTVHQQFKHLSPAAQLAGDSSLSIVRSGIKVISLILLLLIIWACFAPVREITRAPGEVVPKNRVQIIQHLEGGIVSMVLVQDGDKVQAGQLLVQLSPVQAQADLQQMQSRATALQLDMQRLQMYVDGKVIPNTIVPNSSGLTVLAQNKQILLNLQNESRLDQRAILAAQLAQKHEDVNQFQAEQISLQKQVALIMEEQQMYEKLVATGVVSKRDYLEAQRNALALEEQLSKVSAQAQQAQQTVVETQSRLNELDASLKQNAVKELNDTHAQLLETQQQIGRLQDRVQRLDITAPSPGIVKGLDLHVGSVIPASGVLLNIVPTNQKLVIEAKVLPTEIGQIIIGDPVKIKIYTYDYTRYGVIDGSVTSISGTTFTDDAKASAYYRVMISMDKEYLGKNPDNNRLMPGMTVEADIVTGSKSVMQYLLRPLQVAMSSSFHEK